MIRSSARANGRPPARAPRTGADAFTVVLHWGLVAALVISLLTGLRIATDYGGSLAGRLAEPLRALLLQGAVIRWHVWAGWTLTFIAISYAAFIWRSRQMARIVPGRSVRSQLRHAWRKRRVWRSVSAWFAINVLVYQVAFALIALMAITGWMLYGGAGLGISPYAIATVHGLSAYSFLVYLVAHVASQLKTGRFWTIFKPRLGYPAAAGSAVVLAGVAITGVFLVDRGSFSELRIAQVARAPVLDGDPSDVAWREAPALAIRTTRGANLPGGEATVDVSAVHDGEHVYFRFRWPDAQRSQKHLPLVKRQDGWQVLQSDFGINDENEYYEDKFAVVLADRAAIASGTVHLGQDLMPGPHRPITRGLHFTEDGAVLDMWHWKSVRTGAMGLVDDNYFGPPQPSEQPGARYTGGYAQDPHEAGGYVLNWTKLDPDRSLAEARVVPAFLPRDPALLERLGAPDLDPEAGDEGIWHLERSEVVPYDPAFDRYPIGTVLPGVIVDGAFEGDRGDLRAGAEWRDGHWTLEVSRSLDTGSAYDVPLERDVPIYLWVSVFNHTQIRHSQHLHPVRLTLE